MFVPEHVAMKTASGQTHYRAILKHVVTPEEVDRVFRVDAEKSQAKLKTIPNWPYIDSLRLCDIRPDDIQRLMSAAVTRGYSIQTVTHIRSVVSAIFAFAKKVQYFGGDNPASQVPLPEMIRKDAHTLTLAQVREVLAVMRYPEREMALIVLLTNLNVAEICGLQWKWLNLTEAWSTGDEEPIPPRTIAVRNQWYCGELSGVDKRSRNRNLPIPAALLPVLLGLRQRTKFAGPDDYVLVSRNGSPIHERNIAVRRLRPIGKDLQIPWLSWQVFRRTQKILPYELGNNDLANQTALANGVAGTAAAKVALATQLAVAD
jgi:integrase